MAVMVSPEGLRAEQIWTFIDLCEHWELPSGVGEGTGEKRIEIFLHGWWQWQLRGRRMPIDLGAVDVSCQMDSGLAHGHGRLLSQEQWLRQRNRPGQVFEILLAKHSGAISGQSSCVTDLFHFQVITRWVLCPESVWANMCNNCMFDTREPCNRIIA